METKYYKKYILFFSSIVISIFLFYFFIYPNSSGVIGAFIQEKFFYIFGKANYLLPFLFLMMGFRFLHESEVKYRFLAAGFFLLLTFSANILELMLNNESGGVIGYFFSEKILVFLIGRVGAYLISFFSIILGFYFLNFSVVLHLGQFIKKGFLLLGIFYNKITARIKRSKELKAEIMKTPLSVKKQLKKIKIERYKKQKDGKEEGNIAIVNAFNESNTHLSTNSTEDAETMGEYQLPSTDLLDKKKIKTKTNTSNYDELKENAYVLQQTLQNFGVNATVTNIAPGPVITRYEVELAAGVKVATIVSLQNDICLAMKSQNVRILSPIPGKAAIGIEMPNKTIQPVTFRDILENFDFKGGKLTLPFAIGKTVEGEIACTDIAKTPHLLVAGATGSGKSVCINALIMSILYTKKPNEVKFIMVDPKVVELAFYRDIPHLYSPVITNPKEASRVLQQVVGLMEERYAKFAEAGARNIESYNEKMQAKGVKKEFYLIVIIDELADLMLVASKDVEESIARLTQKARAVGIHVVLATQRPSVNVITGLIKANLPSRISFQVLSKIDSRVILDTNGAENLIGRGDMLFLENGASRPVRLQGAFLSEKEVQHVMKFIKSQGKPDYSAYSNKVESMSEKKDGLDDKTKEDFLKALKLVLERQKVSYDLMRANGFSGPKATNLISLMEIKGFIEKPAGTKQWEIYFESIEDYLRV
ncbi:MAG: DNA translocase FtsK [bacterium]|nr:DNA translocase FtsK [bacterium]